jgi:outer membrane protein OmpA-like peptidoglycan-associated protein
MQHSKTKRVGAWLGSSAMLLAAIGCSSNKLPPPSAPESASSLAPAQSTLTATRNDRETTVQLSAEIMQECRFPASPADVPRFELDNATLRTHGRNVLDDVANCMKDGPLQNRTITLIGRADPRGSKDHNHELGAGRADAARNYLIAHGVLKEKLLVVSRGEEGARGDDEASWAIERRVDLVLGDRTDRTSINEHPAADAKKPTPTGNAASVYADQAEGGPSSGQVTGTSGPGTASGPAK